MTYSVWLSRPILCSCCIWIFKWTHLRQIKFRFLLQDSNKPVIFIAESGHPGKQTPWPSAKDEQSEGGIACARVTPPCHSHCWAEILGGEAAIRLGTYGIDFRSFHLFDHSHSDAKISCSHRAAPALGDVACPHSLYSICPGPHHRPFWWITSASFVCIYFVFMYFLCQRSEANFLNPVLAYPEDPGIVISGH